MTKKTGTKEWAGDNINFQIGCEHDCRYCYARAIAVDQYGYCPSNEAWKKPVINQKKVDAPHKKKFAGKVMFPSTHDITPSNINEYLCVLRKLLDAGNDVLIVSKPHWNCITIICEQYADYIDQIMFRFTIGSASDDILQFWEPNAPNLTERLTCLQYAHKCGYKTGVSCEPFLDAWPSHVYLACEQWVTDTIWFGKMRNFESRVDFSGISDEDKSKYVVPLMASQIDSFVLPMVEQMKDWPKVRWKDSVKEVIKKINVEHRTLNVEL